VEKWNSGEGVWRELSRTLGPDCQNRAVSAHQHINTSAHQHISTSANQQISTSPLTSVIDIFPGNAYNDGVDLNGNTSRTNLFLIRILISMIDFP
jgi:hypothetical protein